MKIFLACRAALLGVSALLPLALSQCQPQGPAEREASSSPGEHRSDRPPPAPSEAIPSAPKEAGTSGASAASPPETTKARPPRGAPGDDARREVTWDRLFSFLASNCYVDELGPTNYTHRWLRYHYPRRDMPRGAPYPRRRGAPFPEAGSPGAALRARDLRARWLAAPESHVVDCTFLAPKRDCTGCASPSPRPGIDSSYVAYLPAALFREPERVRAALLLVPGGNGERSRPFLTPVPGKTIWDKGSGGLETKRLVDEYIAAHPDAAPLLVLALHSTGDEHVNGSTEHLTHDVPHHVGGALLGGVDPADIAVGVEGVSSGARAIVRALHAKPRAFRTVGLSCLACGGVDPREEVLATRPELEAWGRALGEGVRASRLRVRFAMGGRDNQLECARALHAMWAAGGVFDAARPAERVNCKASNACDTALDGFTIYAGELHDYRFLTRSYPEQLAFHLSVLTSAGR